MRYEGTKYVIEHVNDEDPHTPSYFEGRREDGSFVWTPFLFRMKLFASLDDAKTMIDIIIHHKWPSEIQRFRISEIKETIETTNIYHQPEKGIIFVEKVIL